GTAEQEIIVFPRTYEECRDLIKDEAILIVSGRVDNKDDRGLKVLADTIQLASETTMDMYTTQSYEAPQVGSIAEDDKGELVITVPRNGQAEALLQLKQLIVSNPGEVGITLVLPNGPNGPRTMRLPMRVSATTDFRQQITSLFNTGTKHS